MREIIEAERLRAVAQRLRGVGMNLHHHPVWPHGMSGESKRNDEVPLARGVRRVDEDRKVCELLENRYRTKVERVACGRFECPYPALAEDDLLVSLREDVLGCVQEL